MDTGTLLSVYPGLASLVMAVIAAVNTLHPPQSNAAKWVFIAMFALLGGSACVATYYQARAQQDLPAQIAAMLRSREFPKVPSDAVVFHACGRVSQARGPIDFSGLAIDRAPDSTVRVNGELRNFVGRVVGRFRDSTFVPEASDYDSNSDSRALEVVDDKLTPIWQFKVEGADLFISFVLYSEDGQWNICDGDSWKVGPAPSSPRFPAIPAPRLPGARIFQYPSYRHSGQRLRYD